MGELTKESIRKIKNNITRLSKTLAKKWYQCGKLRDRFEKTSTGINWLNGEDIVFVVTYYLMPSTSSIKPTAGPGRPKIDFDQASHKTKRRRVDNLIQHHSRDELAVAAQVSARLSGNRDAANVIKCVSESPEKATEIKKKMSAPSFQRCLSNNEALAYYVDAKCTSHSYKQSRKWALKAGHNVYPSFNNLRKAKSACYVPKECVFINETQVEIKLQAILNKTAERLISVQSDVLKNVSCSKVKLVSKWGCDGSSGYSTYKQKFTNPNDTDEYLFVFSFVPIRLYDGNDIIWQNPRPSSTMYCRPIKFIFSKESTDLTIRETNKVSEEINQLVPTACEVNGREVTVEHEMLLTMIDGKVCNALTDTLSSLRCYLCGLTAKNLNDENRDYTVDPDKICFGLSTLHALLRCFECLLHISYRLDVKKWQVRGEEDKMYVQHRSNLIKKSFKEKLGLIIDKPKPGYGSTNDGNTARRFFENPELSAEITGLDVTLLKNFSFLLRALSSGYDINIEAFEKLARETRSLYLHNYSWYYMPPTVHKILVHSTDIIKHYMLPIGQLSEEAQEARNKDCRRFREHHTRKNSRVNSNNDLLSMLLITSDPVINSLREVPKKKTGRLPSEVLELIRPPKVNVVMPATNPVSTHDYTEDDSSDGTDDSNNED